MVKNAKSRMFHGFMVGASVLLCFIAIISIGSFAFEHNKIRGYVRNSGGGKCILFATSDGEKDPHHKDSIIVHLRSGKSCVLAIWGETAICFASLLLAVLFLVKTLIGMKSLSCLVLVELPILVLAGLFSFSIATVISIGLRETCDAFIKKNPVCDNANCRCYGAKLYIDEQETSFYSNIHAAEVTAWIATLILAGMSATYTLLLFVYCYRLRHPTVDRNQDGMYDPLADVVEGKEEIKEPAAV